MVLSFEEATGVIDVPNKLKGTIKFNNHNFDFKKLKKLVELDKQLDSSKYITY